MRAAVLHAPRDLRVEERPPPGPDPGPGEVRVRVGAGGICGSDLHYFLHGGFGAVRLREPMILGHEIAGTVEAVGPGVGRVAVGDTVAVDPSRPCGACRHCREGSRNHCLDMRFFGSAMRFPHVQGGFREVLTCEEARAVPVGGLSVHEAAFAEPLAVCLHAVSRAGPVLGRRVLVTGAGPIGLLAVAAARRAGAGEIVATDLHERPLAVARRVGADRAANVGEDPEALREYEADKGSFDVVLEASGSAAALAAALPAVRPKGVVVLIGNGGEAALPMMTLVAKELELRGTFRFGDEFATAARFIAGGLIDVRPLLTDVLPLAEAREAFELAADKGRSVKVQLAFG